MDHELLDRVRAEYLEMPGMRLTARQVHRLCGMEAAACTRVLDTLVARKFLRLHADGTYARSSSDGTIPGPRRAQAA